MASPATAVPPRHRLNKQQPGHSTVSHVGEGVQHWACLRAVRQDDAGAIPAPAMIPALPNTPPPAKWIVRGALVPSSGGDRSPVTLGGSPLRRISPRESGPLSASIQGSGSNDDEPQFVCPMYAQSGEQRRKQANGFNQEQLPSPLTTPLFFRLQRPLTDGCEQRRSNPEKQPFSDFGSVCSGSNPGRATV